MDLKNINCTRTVKRVLYVHQYFKTPHEPGGTRSYWLAKALVNEGYEVVMLTTSSGIDDSIVEKKIDGIHVVYFRVPYYQQMSLLSRMVSFVRFMVKSTVYAVSQRKLDLIFATSTPLTVGVTALILKKVRKVPFIFEVRDLWPEVPIQMGAIKNELFKKIALWFEKVIYRNAEHIVVLSPGMLDGVVKHESIEKVSLIPNMSKVDEFWSREKKLELVERLGLRKKSFKIVHFGALGIANGAHTILESAKLLKNNEDIEFVFIGGGAQENFLRELAEKDGLGNVHFLGNFPMKMTSEIVNFCDVSIISFLDLPILYTNSPNKFFDSLSAGKPIIVNSAGWTKDIVESNNCGYYVNPKFPEDLVSKIIFLQKNPTLVREMGINSRKLAEERYDKEILVGEFVQLIKNKIP